MTFCLAILLFTNFGQAQTSDGLKLDPGKVVRLDYESKSWNKNPDVIETGSLLLRDSGSGRMARIQMQESSPNSGQFVGSYQIDYVPTADILPEVYLVPQKLFSEPEWMQKVADLIRDGMIFRKPFFLRQASNTVQAISIFDTSEQTLKAYRDYRSNRALDPAALDSQRLSELHAQNSKWTEKNQAQTSVRLKIEEEENQKLADLQKQHSDMEESQKIENQNQAQKISEEGMQLFKQEKFSEAEKKFAAAAALDPMNKSYFFQYGVCLFKNGRYNRSLVALKIARNSGANPLELQYFAALNHMKLKEYDIALKQFSYVQSKNDPVLSPSSAFFAGIIDFQKENYKAAKPNFEYTLDHSKDPKMDQQAEAYLEQIANIESFLANKAKRFVITLNGNISYDSNILNQAAANAQTDLNGYRFGYGGTFEYRPVYNERHEFSLALSFSDIYSYNKNFEASTEIQKTDPLTAGFTMPYKFKGLLLEKAYEFALTPGYEVSYMDVSETKTGIRAREQIVTSNYVRLDNTFAMNSDWFSTYSIEFRNDTSLIDTSSSPDEDLSGTKITLTTLQTWFKDKKKTESYSIDGTITSTATKGANQKNTRYDLGYTDNRPIFWNSSLSSRAGVFMTSYPTNSSSRADNGINLTSNFRKVFNERWSGTAGLSYLKNNSNVADDAYDKYTLSAGFVYTNAF